PDCPDCTDGPDTPDEVSDITTVKTNNTTTYVPGTTVPYTITVTNNGPSAASSVTVADMAPAGTTISSWTAVVTTGTATLANASGTGDFSELITNMSNGAVVTYTVNVDVPADFTGGLTNTVVVTNPEDPTPDCPDCTDGPDTSINLPPDAVNDMFTVISGGTLTGSVVANDDSTDGPFTQVTLIGGPFNGTLSLNLDGSFTYMPNAGYLGTDVFQYNYCDGGTPNLCDAAIVTITVSENVLQLRPRALLQGALLGNGGGLIMRDDLRTEGYIPTVEPYSGLASFEHRGSGGGESISASVLTDNGQDAIVDWVFVELRSASDSAQVIATRSALLQRDGDIVDTDGSSALQFVGPLDGSYFVSVRHRNHLGAMTSSPVALSSVPAVVDFTDTGSDFYHRIPQFDGFEQAVVEGAYALYLGNTNFNGQVNYAGQSNDPDINYQAIINAVGNPGQLQSYILSGYRATDVNLDGITKYTGFNNDVDPIFNVSVPSPLNSSNIVTFNLIEQLPLPAGE
ncbi:Ig-like domain-containing protein, partial [Phaeodactylibacter luteus]